MSKISIIIPAYNSEKYIKSCLDSIINQTFTNFEVIVINDGSTDNTNIILDEYASLDKRFNIIHQENMGQAISRNKAIDMAKGEYITFIDSDDYIELDMLEEMYNKAVSTNADIVWTNMFRFENGIKTVIPVELFCEDETKNYILNNAGPCSKLIKTDLIKKNKLYFLKGHIYEDFAVVPAYGLYANKIVYLDKQFYNYIIYSGSTMNQLKYNKKLEDIFFSIDSLSKLFENNKYNEELEFIYIYHLLHSASLRFFKFNEGKDALIKIVDLMKNKYPNWMKNKYYKQKGIKFKIVCKLFYKRNYHILKLILK